jgi:4,5-dihydroxyphthalate decarboxylase
MSKLDLTIACGDYDRTRALRDGAIEPEGVRLTYLPLVPGETFWRMLNNREFHGSEMSLSSYTILRSQGDERFLALPVFPSRIFRHSAVYVHTGSGIRAPADLKGKRIGVGDYEMTAAVWVRAFLEHEYGVRPEDLRWVSGRSVRGAERADKVKLDFLEPGQSLEVFLEAGEIDALISVMLPRPFLAKSPKVRRLFPNSRAVEADYYRRTGIFPIMHTFVVRADLLEANPWLAVSLYKAFVKAKELNDKRLYNTDALAASLPWLVQELEENRELFGETVWDYSIDGSRPTLEAFVGYMHEQGLTKRRMAVEELFAPHIRRELTDYLRSTGED